MRTDEWSLEKFQLFEVTSSLRISNWLQLALEQLLYYRIDNKPASIQQLSLISKQKIIDSQHYQHQKLADIKQHQQLPNKSQLLYSHIKIYEGKPTINFADQQSLIALTKCILRVIFGIEWSLPLCNLCPRIPNRLNYLIWIDRYLIVNQQSNSKNHTDKVQSQLRQITSIDIGTGASLIYPLLGAKVFGWKFIATQKDQTSLLNASKLVIFNGLQSVIQLRKTCSPNLIKDTINSSQQVNFVMCNPPFFDSQEDFLEPLGVMTSGQHNTFGGEYEFFFSLYLESFYFSNIEWFTMMIGLGKDFQEIRVFLERQLRQYEVLSEVKFGKINQSDNSRFIIAWRINKCIMSTNKQQRFVQAIK